MAVVYSNAFDTDPGWTTDQPQNFYWDSEAGTFRAKTINGYSPDEAPNRYVYFTANLDVAQSFTISWDQRIIDRDGYGITHFGLYSDDLLSSGVTYFALPNLIPGSTLNVGLGGPGGFRELNIYTEGDLHGDGGGASGGSEAGTFIDRWYTNVLAFDADLSSVTWQITDRQTNELLQTWIRPVTAEFSAGMVNLGIAHDPIGYQPNIIWSLDPTDYQITEFDNVVVSGTPLESISLPPTQIVYVQFDEGLFRFARHYGWLGSDVYEWEPSSSALSKIQQDHIVELANQIYRDFRIEFTREKPSGEYSTVLVTQSVDDLPFTSKPVNGRAEGIDYGNVNKNDNAFVLTEYSSAGGVPNLEAIAQTLAHEVGHLLGLRHVYDDIDGYELMYPYGDSARTHIGGRSQLGEIQEKLIGPDEVTPRLGFQDSHGELAKSLGLKSGQIASAGTFSEENTNLFSFDFIFAIGTLHSVQLLLTTSDGQLIKHLEIGELPSSGNLQIALPAIVTDKILLVGKTTPEGSYDVFASSMDHIQVDLATSTPDEILEAFSIPMLENGMPHTTIKRVSEDGSATDFGSIFVDTLHVTQAGATAGADTLSGDAQVDDVIIGLSGNDHIAGLAGNDRLFGNEGDDSLFGGWGDDDLDGGDVGIDSLDGGEGRDTATYASLSSGVIIDLLSQAAWDGSHLDLLVSVENAVGSRFADLIFGDHTDNSLDGGNGGADTLNGLGGSDTVSYRSLFAGVIIDLISQAAWDGTSLDTLVSIENARGSSFNDSIFGDAQDNVLDGGDGGADSINGGFGGDTVLYVRSSAGVIIDLISQASWDSKNLDVFSSIENAVGSAFDDAIYGHAESNVLDGGVGGADTLNGGDGIDTVSHASSRSGVIIDLGTQTTADGLVTDTLTSIENAIGSQFADVIISNGDANAIDAGAGIDTVSYAGSATGVIVDLIGGASWDGDSLDLLLGIEGAIGSSFADVLYGDHGDNLLDGGSGGADSINGLGGMDTVGFVRSGQGVIIDLLSQAAWDGSNLDTLASIENALGSLFNDAIYGDAGNNTLDGGAGGADMIIGGLGIDTVAYAISASAVVIDLISQATWDGMSLDRLSGIENAIGSSFNDAIYGDESDNVLDGAGGADTLYGGPGSDNFVFRRGDGSGNTVLDFAGNGAEAGDSLIFKNFGTGAQGATFTQVDAIHWNINSSDGTVQDVITFSNGASIHASDFLFV